MVACVYADTPSSPLSPLISVLAFTMVTVVLLTFVNTMSSPINAAESIILSLALVAAVSAKFAFVFAFDVKVQRVPHDALLSGSVRI